MSIRTNQSMSICLPRSNPSIGLWRQTQARYTRAFTLIELLVVIAVVTVIMAISLTSLQAARDRAKRIVCASNLQQIGRGIMAYSTDDDRLPLPGLHGFNPLTNKRTIYPARTWSDGSQNVVYLATIPDTGVEPKKRWVAMNLGFLHQTRTVETAEVLYCPSAFAGQRYEDHAERYTWPFEEVYPPPIKAELLRSSYCYTPQSTCREKLRTDVYAYQAAYRLSTLNNHAVLAIDLIRYDENMYWNTHQGPGGRVGGFNILYGDGSVRFRPTQESEKEYWEMNRETTPDVFRHLLYLYSQ